jgi:uncharacterized membrane-anchored protein
MKANKKCRFPLQIKLAILFLTLGLFFANTGLAQQPAINWMEGPTEVDLGKNLAVLFLEEDYIFADGKDTRKLMEMIGNPPSDAEIGLIGPRTEGQDWYIVFEHQAVGFIKDDEKGEIDSDAIIKNIKAGTEKSNAYRIKRGHPPLHVKGWYTEPYYDEFTHNLTWTILAESAGKEIVNHNIRLLGRDGYISAVLVTDPETLDSLTGGLNGVISTISYKKGKSYAEYVKGDKIAKFGLTALIAGGAATAAVKFGLFKYLAKFWKIVAVGAVAVFSAIAKFFSSIFKRKEEAL